MLWWLLCFFFSSRRRHTSLSGDWSSDVCSSDLLHKSREPRVSCLNPGKTSREFPQHVSRPDSPTMAREQRRAPPRHSHGDPTSLAPHERLPDLAVVPREKPPTGAAAREQPRASPVIERCGASSPACPRDQSPALIPKASAALTPL